MGVHFSGKFWAATIARHRWWRNQLSGKTERKRSRRLENGGRISPNKFSSKHLRRHRSWVCSCPRRLQFGGLLCTLKVFEALNINPSLVVLRGASCKEWCKRSHVSRHFWYVRGIFVARVRAQTCYVMPVTTDGDVAIFCTVVYYAG